MVLPLRAGGEGLSREPSPANTYGGACCADNAGKDRQCRVIFMGNDVSTEIAVLYMQI